ncbi:MAG: hypothetical protein QUU85_16265, partial [Candidatus Eisenbacteria bacterium]|nr:hypothetical protein [Candidatus Eisenbacteria bacterium]
MVHGVARFEDCASDRGMRRVMLRDDQVFVEIENVAQRAHHHPIGRDPADEQDRRPRGRSFHYCLLYTSPS